MSSATTAFSAETRANLDVFALREAIARAGEAFAEFRAGVGPGAASPCWDAIVLTCATESQAQAARVELERRRALGLFPSGCELLTLPDPPRRRVGSGGATLLALETLLARWSGGSARRSADSAASILANRRVLIIHSGGESQRLPAYAALGKIFAPLPVLLPVGVGAATFDWLYLLASGLPGAEGEVTLLSGDVLPIFNPQRLSASTCPVRGVAIPVRVEVGQQFGVYVPGEACEARRILQKPSMTEMDTAGAISPNGTVAVDTGIVTLGREAVARLIEAAGLAVVSSGAVRRGTTLLPREGAPAAWDLYRDWLPRLAAEPAAVPIADEIEECLAAATRGLVAGVSQPTEGAFVHLGTSRDFHLALVGETPLRTLFPFASQRDSAIRPGAIVTGAFVGRSLLGRGVVLEPGAAVDHCRAEGTFHLGADAMASGVQILPGEALSIAPTRVCYQTLLTPAAGKTARRITVVLGLDDNPKLALPEASFNGQPLAAWMMSRGVRETDLWREGSTRSLWEASLFVEDTADPERRILSWLQQPASGDSNREMLAHWRASQRHSLHDLLDEADVAAVAAWRERLTGDVVAARVAGDVEANGDTSFVQVFAGLTAEQRAETLARITAAGDERNTPNALHRARYWRVAADLAPESEGAFREQCEDRAAAAVRQAVSRPATAAAGAGLHLEPGLRVRVAAPVRVDFGGGWTDTPPFSLERGGAVFNAALSLDGQLPMYAEVEVTREPRLVLQSDDIGSAVELVETSEVAGYADPSDPFSLAKACLVLLGVLGPTGPSPEERLRRAGAGLRLRTGARIPRGSGLGGSSVLGAVLLRALGEALGAPQSDEELSQQTLELEQLMTTGGGWQDQMGAIAPGVKLVSTEPGLEQRPIVEPLPLSPMQRQTLEAHLLVAYTGHHRLAKNILRQVVMRYLDRDPLAMQALYQLRSVATRLYRAAAEMDLELVGTLVNQAWLLNKTLDPQTSYPAVERLFSALAPHVHGVKLVGAGGGGFLVAITREPNQHALVADVMARDREFAYGYVVPSRIWDGGLQIVRQA